jgi:acyl-CoA thioester hydrolase
MKKFEKEIEIRWSDVDQNRHVRHSAYYDYAAHLRTKFLAEIGFDAQKLNELNIGPVILKEECNFLKELNPNETVTVNVLIGDNLNHPTRWTFHHEVFNQKGEKCAHITVRGVWINLKLRRITKPPIEFENNIFDLPAGQDFEKKSKRKNV